MEREEKMKRICSAFLALLLTCALLPGQVWASENPVPVAKQAVVNIVAGVLYDDNGEITYFDEEAGTGTGFGVGPAGEDAQTFVTNRHVVTVGDTVYDTVYIRIDGADLRDGKTMIECDVIFVGEDGDYAIIQSRSPIQGVTTLPLLPAEEMETGDRVYALGFPGIADEMADSNQYTTEDITVTDGTISRYITHTNSKYTAPQKMMAHTASINHGNSGGPLINEKGQAIGINTYMFYEDGADTRYYALYIDYAMAALDQLGIEYVDASQLPQQAEDAPAEKTNFGLIAAVAAGVLVLAGIAFFLVKTLGKPARQGSLVVMATSGPMQGQRWPLQGIIRVGRSPDCQIRYPADTRGVSRNHCTICLYRENHQQYVAVTDSGSTYGTFPAGSHPGAGGNYVMKVTNDFYREFCIGSEENRLLITSQLPGGNRP